MNDSIEFKLTYEPTGVFINERLNKLGLSKKEIAEKLGISPRHLHRILHSENKITQPIALKLSELCPDVEPSVWIKYDTDYRLNLTKKNEGEGEEQL